jgi:hypothetical protein
MPYKDKEKERIKKREYWERNKERHRALVRENSRKKLAEMTVEQRRAMWRAEKERRMQDPERKRKIYEAHKKWRESGKGEDYNKREDVILKRRKASASYRERNWDKCLEYIRRRRKTVPHVKVIESVRRRINDVVAAACRY